MTSRSHEESTIDETIRRSGLPSSGVSVALLGLEMKRLVIRRASREIICEEPSEKAPESLYENSKGSCCRGKARLNWAHLGTARSGGSVSRSTPLA